jgi:hypothetical protein
VRRNERGFVLLTALMAALFAAAAVEAVRVRSTQALEAARRRDLADDALRRARDAVRRAAPSAPPGRVEGAGEAGGVTRRASAAWDGARLSDWRED